MNPRTGNRYEPVTGQAGVAAASTLKGVWLTDVAILTLIWISAALVVGPVGDFPLNDDWSYGLTVKHLLDSGHYQPLGWAFMTLVTNVVWGSLFCLATGFSFTALRLATLVAALLGVIGGYVLVRDLHRPRWLALLLAATLALNPIFYPLSHTFMTDVPFSAIIIWSCVFLVRSIRSGSQAQMAIGTAFAVAATLSRQIALCVPLAFAVTVLLQRPLTLRSVFRAIVPAVLSVGAFLAFRIWLAGHNPAVVFDYNAYELHRALTDCVRLARNLLGNGYVVLVYLGLFLLPVLLSVKGPPLRLGDKRAMAIAISGLLLLAAGAATRTHYGDPVSGKAAIMPMVGNILVTSGVGPLSLRDTLLLRLEHVAALPPTFWICVTAMGLMGSLMLIFRLGSYFVETTLQLLGEKPVEGIDSVPLFLALCAGIYLMPVLASFLFDRYLIPPFFFLAAAIVAISNNTAEQRVGLRGAQPPLALGVLIVLGIYAIAGTRDYLEWNRVRWTALEELMATRQETPDDIDGGFEFNGYYLYDPKVDIFRAFSNPERSWYWVHRDTYLLTFGAVPGYTVVKEYNIRWWLPWHLQPLMVLRKQAATEPASAKTSGSPHATRDP